MVPLSFKPAPHRRDKYNHSSRVPGALVARIGSAYRATRYVGEPQAPSRLLVSAN